MTLSLLSSCRVFTFDFVNCQVGGKEEGGRSPLLREARQRAQARVPLHRLLGRAAVRPAHAGGFHSLPVMVGKGNEQPLLQAHAILI